MYIQEHINVLLCSYFMNANLNMKHLIADFSKLEVIECLYHRTYMTHINPTLLVSIDGKKKNYSIRWRAATRDKLYHSKGLKCVLIVYDGIVLAYEIIKFDEVSSYQNIESLKEIMKNSDDVWYFDHEKFYKLDSKPSTDFISIQTVSIVDPIHITYSTTLEVTSADVFVITSNDEVILQTPPIAYNLENKDKEFSLLNREQNTMYLSLSMLIRMCSTITKIYPPEEIEKFDIPQYMIRHKTVNLANMPPYVKDNSTTVLKPVEAVSYLLGLMHKESDLENNLQIVKILKAICRSGVINSRNTLSESIYKDKKMEIAKIKL